MYSLGLANKEEGEAKKMDLPVSSLVALPWLRRGFAVASPWLRRGFPLVLY